MSPRRPSPTRLWPRLGLLCALVATAGAACSGEPASEAAAEPSDPEGRAVTFLTRHLFDPADRLTDRFAPGVQPADFPLRLLVDTPSELAFVDVWRVRAMDARVVVEALVTLRGAPHVQVLWLAEHQGSWRIAGWAPRPTPVSVDAPAPTAGPRVPRPFAGPMLRGGRASPLLPVDTPAAPVAGPDTVSVTVKAFDYQGACAAQARLGAALEGLRDRLAPCAASDTPRGGRLTFAVTADGPAGRSRAEVVESTLLDSELSACLVEVFNGLPVVVGPDAVCTAQVRVTLRPK